MCAAAHLGRRPTRDVLLEIVNRAQSRILAAQRAPIKTQGQGRGACQGVATILQVLQHVEALVFFGVGRAPSRP